mgnify:CR=1 FL=1
MFDTRTALVLGAGASVPFGYPLGPKLIDNIAEGLKKALKRSPPETWPTASFDFIGNLYDIFVDYVNMFWEQPMRDRLQKVAAYLSTASHASIDDVARTNPSMRRIIKILVALEIARASYEREEFRKNKLKPSRVLFRRSDENWYARLISKLTEDCHEPEDIYSNALSVITFNYDMSLEHYLHDKLPASELFRKVEVDRVCRPLHIHGDVAPKCHPVAT